MCPSAPYSPSYKNFLSSTSFRRWPWETEGGSTLLTRSFLYRVKTLDQFLSWPVHFHCKFSQTNPPTAPCQWQRKSCTFLIWAAHFWFAVADRTNDLFQLLSSCRGGPTRSLRMWLYQLCSPCGIAQYNRSLKTAAPCSLTFSLSSRYYEFPLCYLATGALSIVLCFSWPIRTRANVVKQSQIGSLSRIFLKPITPEILFPKIMK